VMSYNAASDFAYRKKRKRQRRRKKRKYVTALCNHEGPDIDIMFTSVPSARRVV
jgi:hypothetical protein